MIRPVTPEDIPAITRIYNHYVRNTVVTFEERDVSEQEMRSRIQRVQQANLPWLVYEQSGEAVGYAYASQWKERSAYRFSVEATVYVSSDTVGCGLGSRLYESLFARLKQQGVHAIMGGITLPNTASVALHEKFHMKKVAHFSEVGFKFNRRLDVGYWQILMGT